MRHEKAETLLRVALGMAGSAEGLSLQDIQRNFSDRPLSRRTAERLRDAVERLFPQLEQANPGDLPKRWRLPDNSLRGLAAITANELADLAIAAAVLRGSRLAAHADTLDRIASKLKAATKRVDRLRIEPDLDLLNESEGIVFRPGPRPKLDGAVIAALRDAILASRKVRIHYRYRGSGKRGFETVRPYGFLYGSRHYLVAWSENAGDFRNYALANIERSETLTTSFARRRNFSLTAYVEQSFGVFRETPFETIWRFDATAAPHAREFLFHPSQTLKNQADGSLVVRIKAGGALEMAWHLRQWGEHVTVLKPKNFWRRVRKAEAMALP
jgi:predicted DNA-binding transcriptional regulator YafY